AARAGGVGLGRTPTLGWGPGSKPPLMPSDEPSRFGQQNEWQLCANFVPIRRGARSGGGAMAWARPGPTGAVTTIDSVIERYSRPAMKAIWSDEGRLARWFEVELAALE